MTRLPGQIRTRFFSSPVAQQNKYLAICLENLFILSWKSMLFSLESRHWATLTHFYVE